MNEILKIVVSLSLSAGLVTLVLLALRPLYRTRLHKNWQYYIWLVVVARLLIPLAPETNLVGAAVERLQRPAAETVEQQEPRMAEDNSARTGGAAGTGSPAAPVQQDDAVAPATTPQEAESAILADLAGNMWMLWFATALVLLARKVTSYHSFSRFIKAGRQRVTDPDVLEAYRLACEDCGVERPLPLYQNRLAVSPMLVGILRPSIVLPQTGLDAEKLRLVFRHELTHFRRGDILYKWLVQLAVCIHWFNPLVYLMSREVSKTCELSCDELVLRRLGAEEKRRYGDTLLATLHSGGTYGDTVASVTLGEDAKLLKERLEAIIRHVRKPKVVTACSVALATLLLCGAAFTGAYTGARSVAAPEVLPVSAAVEGGRADTATAPDRETDTESDWPDWNNIYKGQNGTYTINGGNSFYYNWGNYFYREGYIFHLEWRQNGDLALYPASVKLLLGSREYDLALAEEAKDYEGNDTLLEAVQASLVEMMARSGSNNQWDTGVFILREVAGPYSETPDQLLAGFYEAEEQNHFLAVLPHVQRQTMEAMLERAYTDNRDRYCFYILDELPADFNADDLAERALADNRRSLLYSLIEHTTAEKRGALMQEAYDTNNSGLVSFLYDELPKEEINDLLRRAYNDQKMSIFSILADEADREVAAEVAEKAFADGRTSYFSVIMDRLTGEELAAYASRAYDNGGSSMISILSGYLPAGEAGALAKRAYEDGNMSAFSLYLDDADDTTVRELAEQAFNDQRISYFSNAADNLDRDELESYARRAYDLGSISFISSLADYLSAQDAGTLAKRAYNDGYMAAFSTLIYEADAESVRELAELAYVDGKISYFTAVMYELSSEDLNAYAKRAVDDKKSSFISVLLNYM